MTVRFTRSTTIDAPKEQVFDLAIDVDFHTESLADTGEEIVDGVRSGAMELGDTVRWRAKHFGLWWEMTSVITEHDRPHRFIDEQQSGPFRRFCQLHRFVDAPNGGTVMVDEIEFDAPFGPIGRIAEELMLRRHLEAVIDTRGAEIKRALSDEG